MWVSGVGGDGFFMFERLENLGHAWEQGGLGSPLPPSLHTGRDFSKEQL